MDYAFIGNNAQLDYTEVSLDIAKYAVDKVILYEFGRLSKGIAAPPFLPYFPQYPISYHA